jgi:hypothetical protein
MSRMRYLALIGYICALLTSGLLLPASGHAGIGLAGALDNPVQIDGVTPLVFSSSSSTSSGLWSVVTATLYTNVFGVAAQSGAIGGGEYSSVTTTVTGPASLSFYQKVSSQPTYDNLTFSLDGLIKSAISGTVNWQQKMFTLPTGTHTLVWKYAKNLTLNGGFDAAWLDKVVVSPNPALKVTYPDGGENLIAGTPVNITWNAPAAAEKYDLYYTTNNGTTWTLIIGNYTSPGFTGITYPWTWPAMKANMTACKVKVVAKNYTGAVVGTAVSDKVFAINNVRLTSPNGGNILPAGGSFDVTWDSAAAATRFNISYTMNNGATWSSLETDATGTDYSWTPLPVPAGGNKTACKVKIVAYDSLNKIIGTDISDAAFLVQVLKVTSPNGGEVLNAHTTPNFAVMFNIYGLQNAASATLSYTMDGGLTWPAIVTIPVTGPADYSYGAWAVPAVTSQKTACKVKVVIKSSTGAVLASDTSDANFTIQPVFTLSGTVTAGGKALAGVTMTLGGDDNVTTTTNVYGKYSFTKLLKGNYTVTASLSGYVFNPAISALAISTASIATANFMGISSTNPTYSISGSISGATTTSVTISLAGPVTATVVCGMSGIYTVPNLPSGNYTVTPSKTGYAFNPVSTAVSVTDADTDGVDFTSAASTGAAYSISGKATLGGAGLPGVLITASSGTTNASSFSDPLGNYTVKGLKNGTYILTPSATGYVFTPASVSKKMAGANITGTNFVATVLAAPTNLVATAISNVRIDLSWTDNSNNEDGFKIEKSADGTTFSDLATVGANVTSYSDTGLTALTTYYYRVRAYNSKGNSAYTNVAEQMTKANPPVVFYVDAPVVWNGVNTPVTVYAANVNPPINSIKLVSSGTSSLVADLSASITIDGGHPNRAKAVVPALAPAGMYDVIVEDQNASPGVLTSGLQIVQGTTFSITSVTPPFGYNGTDNSVTIGSLGSFIATPKAYLVPNSGGTASPLSVAFSDSSTLTAIVPSGLTSGSYDVIVVNPNGSVGILSNGFNVTTSPAPQITNVTPSWFATNYASHVILVSGKNFSGSMISLTSCRDASGNNILAPPVTSGTVNCGAGCTQSATLAYFPIANSICVLRLTNSDGSYADYSAIDFTDPNGNLSSPSVGTDMNIGRRALAAAASNTDGAARFVYAIGGDDGAASNPTVYDSVEYASVDQFGTMGQWSLLPRSHLNTPRAFAASSVIGRYIYIAGGDSGSGAVNSAERAMILSPLEAPDADIDDLVLAANGLDPGFWYYRVSAIFSVSDADNPNGESLPSNELAVNVPSFQGKKIQAVLNWSAPTDSLGALLPNVAGYNIYRTPMANGIPGNETLIATVDALTLVYTDNGSETPGIQTPLPVGSLGKWTTLPAMSSSRKGAAGAAAVDPADSSKFYLYALLGLDQTSTALATYEYLPITLQPNGHQTASSVWTSGTNTSAQGRWQLNAWVADSTVSRSITGTTTYVYLGGGMLTNSSLSRTVEVGLVGTGGDLGTLVPENNFSSNMAGYGACAVNNHLYTFGGESAAPSGRETFAMLTTPPSLQLWGTQSITLIFGRYLMGSSVENAFIFLIGGQTDEPSVASRTTEVIMW